MLEVIIGLIFTLLCVIWCTVGIVIIHDTNKEVQRYDDIIARYDAMIEKLEEENSKYRDSH